MKIRKPKPTSEYDIQCQIVEYFNRVYPHFILYSTSNEACYRRSAYYHASGMVSGAPDFQIIIDKRTIYFELKNAKGRQSDVQKMMQVRLKKLNQRYYLIRSLDDFKAVMAVELLDSHEVHEHTRS